MLQMQSPLVRAMTTPIVAGWRIGKKTLPRLSVVAALICLPAWPALWPTSPAESTHGAIHLDTARRCIRGVLCGQRSAELNQLVRRVERWPAGSLAMKQRRATCKLDLRRPARARMERPQFSPARSSLQRRVEAPRGDDPPA